MPTWITPLALIVVTSVLIPGTSFLGHLCGVTVGYLCEFLQMSILQLLIFNSRIGLSQISGTTRKDPEMDRRQAKSPWPIATLCIC